MSSSTSALPRGLIRRRFRLASSRRWTDVALGALATLVVGAPALFTNHGFVGDDTNHLWLVGVQERAISAHLAPTYFLNTAKTGVFYPFYMFYGGTLYAIGGVVAVLLGGAIRVSYVGISLLAIAAAYGGFVWLARALGMRSWTAHAPAITYVASAYYITNIYGRGAWPEFIATSMIPLLLASAWDLARRPAASLTSAVLFVVSASVFAGSHNISLLLGAIASATAIALLLPAGGRRMIPSLRRLGLMTALLALAVGVDAWFLLPDIVYEAKTVVSASLVPGGWTAAFDTPGNIFDPLRRVPPHFGTNVLFVQAPDFLLLWALTAVGVGWRSAGRPLRRAALGLATLLVLVLIPLMILPVWNALPKLIREAQFPYRLDTYVSLACAGLVLVGALAVQRSPRWRQVLTGALGAAVAISVGICLWQLWVPDSDIQAPYPDVSKVFASPEVAPLTWYDPGDYRDTSLPVVPVTKATVTIPPAAISGNGATVTITPPTGLTPFATNIAGGPYAVRIGGPVIEYGRTPTEFLVLRRAHAGSGPLQITLRVADGAVATGRDITLVSVCLLAVGLLGTFVTRCRRRTRSRRVRVSRPVERASAAPEHSAIGRSDAPQGVDV